MIKVEIRIKTAGHNKVEKGWWAEVTPTITGEGSGRRVAVKGDPRWLPKPQKEGDSLVAWVERPAGTFIRAGGDVIGGYRHARVASPVLIVEEGASWHGWARDGSRSVEVWVTNARPATEEDVVASAATEEGGGQKDAVALLQEALASLRAGQVGKAEVAISEAIALLGMLAETGA